MLLNIEHLWIVNVAMGFTLCDMKKHHTTITPYFIPGGFIAVDLPAVATNSKAGIA